MPDQFKIKIRCFTENFDVFTTSWFLASFFNRIYKWSPRYDFFSFHVETVIVGDSFYQCYRLVARTSRHFDSKRRPWPRPLTQYEGSGPPVDGGGAVRERCDIFSLFLPFLSYASLQLHRRWAIASYLSRTNSTRWLLPIMSWSAAMRMVDATSRADCIT